MENGVQPRKAAINAQITQHTKEILLFWIILQTCSI